MKNSIFLSDKKHHPTGKDNSFGKLSSPSNTIPKLKSLAASLCLIGLLLGFASSLKAQTASTPVGDGSCSNPYQIGSLGNLYWIAEQTNNLSAPNDFTGKYFVQTADIDASATSSWTNGWTPISRDVNAGVWFSGSYDGKGHTISGLCIKPGNDISGLFGFIAGGELKNIGLINISVTSTADGSGAATIGTGGLVGYIYSTTKNIIIDNCSVTGSVTAMQQVGGLIGVTYDEALTTIKVSNCQSTCTVTATLGDAGGFISTLTGMVSITNCYATGAVSGILRVGGFAADNLGSISSCYATGSVTGKSQVGGLVANNTIRSSVSNSFATGAVSSTSTGTAQADLGHNGGLIGYNAGKVSYCYATGSVTANEGYNGGLIGRNGGLGALRDEVGTVDADCFWNSDANTDGCGLNATNATFSATGKSSADLKTLATFTGSAWDFTGETSNGTNDYWKIDAAQNNGYPSLTMVPTPTIPVISTSAPTGVSSTSATVGGLLSDKGHAIITGSGVVYSSQNTTPTVGGANVSDLPSGIDFSTSLLICYSSQASSLTPSTVYYARAYATNSAGTGYGEVESFTTLPPSATPTITLNPSSLSSLTTTTGTASSSQSFTVSGSNLTADATVSVTSDFEISYNGSAYGSTATIPQTAGSISAQTVSVRIAASTAANSSLTGNISISSTGATTQNIALSGIVNAAAVASLTASTSSLSGFATTNGNVSTAQSFTVSGSNLSADASIAAPTDFEVSTDGTNYAATASISKGSGTITNQPVYVRIAASAAVGSPSGNVSITSGTASQDVAVSGTVSTAPVASLTASTSSLSGFATTIGNVSTAQSFTVSGSNLSADASIAAPTDFEVSTDGTNYAATASISKGSGTFTNQTVYVRIAASAAVGSPSGNVSITSGTASQDVAVSGTVSAAAVPSLTSSTSTLNSFTTITGMPSLFESFTISGTNLTNDISITVPAGFEISVGGSSYASTASIGKGSGTVTNQTVSVRIAASASVGSPSGNVSITSTGATSLDIAVSGTVSAAAVASLTASTNSLSGFATTNGNVSTAQSFTVSGSNLSADASIAAPTDFEVSTDGTNYAATASISKGSGTITNQPVYVRIAASAAVGSPSGNVSITSGTASQDVAVSGTVSTTPAMPSVTTQNMSNLAATTATANGNITSLGSSNPTEYGVVWGTGTNPTTALTTKTTLGAASATGAFTSSLTGLSPNTTYYVRAYATNREGTSYGNEVSFTTKKLTQSITGFSANIAKTYGNAAFTVSATPGASGESLIFSSENESVAYCSSTHRGQVTIVGAGTALIKINQAGNSSYEASTEETITLTVAPKSITVHALISQTKEYGKPDKEEFDYSYSAPLEGTDTFTGKLSRLAGEDVGNYPFALGTLTAGNNYSISFESELFTITPKAITVTAKASQTKVYGEAEPSLGYDVAPALIGTDAFTGSLERTAGENVSIYPISQGTLSAGSNYSLSFVGGSFSIRPKPIVITADASQSKSFGAADPASFSYQVSPSLVGTDALTGKLSRIAGESVSVYPITIGNLDAGSNYSVTFVSNDFTINKKALTANITANPNLEYVKGGAAVTFTATYDDGCTFTGAPKISFAGAGTTLAAEMTSITSLIWMYQWDPTPSTGDGTINISLAVPDAEGKYDQSFRGKTSIVLDNTIPTVSLNSSPAVDFVKGGDVLNFTATLSDLNGINESPAPRITIGNEVLTVAMNKVSNTEWTFAWTVPADINKSVEVTVSALDRAGNNNQSSLVLKNLVIDNIKPDLFSPTLTCNLIGLSAVQQLTFNEPILVLPPFDTDLKSAIIFKLHDKNGKDLDRSKYTVELSKKKGTSTALTIKSSLLCDETYYLAIQAGAFKDRAGNLNTLIERTFSTDPSPAVPVVAAASTANDKAKLCPGDLLNCTNTAAYSSLPISYQWKLDGNDLSGQTTTSYVMPEGAKGVYSLYVKNTTTGCSSTSATATEDTYSILHPSITAKKEAGIVSLLLVDNTSNSFVGYAWSKADGSAVGSSVVSDRQFLTLPGSLSSGSYKVQVTDKNGCKVMSDVKTVKSTPATMLYPTENDGAFKLLYSNEAQGRVILRAINQFGVVASTVVYEKELNAATIDVDMKGLAVGAYTLEIIMGTSRETAKFFVK